MGVGASRRDSLNDRTPDQTPGLGRGGLGGVGGVAGVVEGVEAGRGVSVLYGRGFLLEKLCGLEFEISPESFFQTNTRQAEVLYNMVAEAAGE